jgi:hypothetical protein
VAAHDTDTDRIVAIEVLPAHFSDNEDFKKQFRCEAHAAARLSAPHVVPIHHYGEIDGRLDVDMRLVEGRERRDHRRIFRHYSVLPSRKRLPPFPMCGYPRFGVLRRLRHPGPVGGRCAQPAPQTGCPRRWQNEDGSRVHCDSFDEGGARVGPRGLTAATPKHFTVVSRPVVETSPGVPNHEMGWDATLSAHIRQVRADPASRDVNAGSSRTAEFDAAGRRSFRSPSLSAVRRVAALGAAAFWSVSAHA